jgi:hypothetical protein
VGWEEEVSVRAQVGQGGVEEPGGWDWACPAKEKALVITQSEKVLSIVDGFGVNGLKK